MQEASDLYSKDIFSGNTDIRPETFFQSRLIFTILGTLIAMEVRPTKIKSLDSSSCILLVFHLICLDVLAAPREKDDIRGR